MDLIYTSTRRMSPNTGSRLLRFHHIGARSVLDWQRI